VESSGDSGEEPSSPFSIGTPFMNDVDEQMQQQQAQYVK
jgi:hypothetical protein